MIANRLWQVRICRRRHGRPFRARRIPYRGGGAGALGHPASGAILELLQHCPRSRQLVRANVVMTALLVDSSTEIDAEFKFGPFGHTLCRHNDIDDIEAHLPKHLDSVP